MLSPQAPWLICAAHASPGHRAAPPKSARRLLARRRRRGRRIRSARERLALRPGRRRARLPVYRHAQHGPGRRRGRHRRRGRRRERPVPGHRQRRPPDRRRARGLEGLAERDRGVGAGRGADRSAAAAVRRGRPAGGDLRHARPARPQGLGPVQGRTGDPDRPGRRPPGGLQDGRRAGRHAVRAGGRDRPLRLRRARPAVGGRGALLGRQPRVGDARRRVGGPLRRRRPPGQAQLDPRSRAQGAPGPRGPRRLPARDRPA